MAYPVSPGHPAYTGVWIPEIWSTTLNEKFYASTTVAAIANTKWEGKIRDQG